MTLKNYLQLKILDPKKYHWPPVGLCADSSPWALRPSSRHLFMCQLKFSKLNLKASASFTDQPVAGAEFFSKPFDPQMNVYGILTAKTRGSWSLKYMMYPCWIHQLTHPRSWPMQVCTRLLTSHLNQKQLSYGNDPTMGCPFSWHLYPNRFMLGLNFLCDISEKSFFSIL